MNNPREIVLEKLKELKINYEIIEHPAVFTIEEMEALEIPDKHVIAKNLFLRDDKKKRYILLVLSNEKQVNLKELSVKINSRPLGFASEDALNHYLGLNKGAVTPFGVLNDDSRCVEVVIDRSLLSVGRIGIHPNENTATVFLDLRDLEKVIKAHGNQINYIEM